MGMEKRGVTADENTVPPEPDKRTKKAGDRPSPACGDDVLSRAADAAADRLREPGETPRARDTD